MTTPIHVLGFSGSLRRDSYNSALLAAAGELLPAGMTLQIFDLSGIPLFNADNEADAPPAVAAFKARLAAADAVLIATPEYNASLPGVLKNALDWASRSPQPMKGKPVAIMGASTGLFGTVRAQQHLRQVLAHLDARPVNKPEVAVPQAQQKFDADLRLADEASRGFVRDLLVALADYTRQLRGG